MMNLEDEQATETEPTTTEAAISEAPADESSGDTAEDASAGKGTSDPESLDEITATFEQEIAEARRKADENWDRFLRSEAERSNARKAAERARKEALSRQRRDLLSRFLEIADNLDRASAFQEADRETLLEGLAGIRREIGRLFEREGVAPIDAMDADFDPNLHDAVGLVQLPGMKGEKVIQVERPGYTLDGEMLRPARVIVGQPAEE